MPGSNQLTSSFLNQDDTRPLGTRARNQLLAKGSGSCQHLANPAVALTSHVFSYERSFRVGHRPCSASWSTRTASAALEWLCHPLTAKGTFWYHLANPALAPPPHFFSYVRNFHSSECVGSMRLCKRQRAKLGGSRRRPEQGASQARERSDGRLVLVHGCVT